MEYLYRGIKNDGSDIRGSLDAASPDEAKRQLRNRGIIVSSLRPHDERQGLGRFSFGCPAIPASLLARFSRDLAVYIRSGVPLPRALSLQQRHYGDTRTVRFITALITALDEGKSLAAALEEQRVYTIPPFYIGTLKASEDRGVLPAVLSELSSYVRSAEQIRAQMIKAFVYPGFIVAVSILTVAFMLTTVVPKISAIFETMGQELPAITRAVLTLSGFFASFWPLMAIGTAAFAMAFASAMRRRPAFRYRVHRSLLALPVVGDMIQTSDLARFSAIASLLIRSGIPTVRAVSLAAATLESSVLKAQFVRGTEKVVEGGKLSASLAAGGHTVLDNAFIAALSIGEETSEVPAMLDNLAELYAQRNSDAIALFLSLLEPALILLVGGFIGGIVTAMLLPIFSLSLGG